MSREMKELNKLSTFEIADGHDFSPLYLINLYKKMIAQEGWEESFFDVKNKNKEIELDLEGVKKSYFYKQIIEAYHASWLCLAINKYYSVRYNLMLSDSPDIIMINKDNCIPIEIYEAFDFSKVGTRERIDIKREVDILKEKKFNKVYEPWTNLLIVNRLKSIEDWFNISAYIKEINNYPYGNFAEIRLYVFSWDEHIFFRVFPIDSQEDLVKIDYSIKRDKEYLY